MFISTLILSCFIIAELFTNNLIEDFKTYKDQILQEYREQKIIQTYNHIPMKDDHIVYLVNLCYIYGVDPDLILAIIWTESHFNPLAKNKSSSARGYGQFIKSTGNSIANQIPEIQNYKHHIHAHDPYISIHMTIYYFNKLLNNNGGNVNKALKCYRGRNDNKYFKLIAQRREHIKRKKSR